MSFPSFWNKLILKDTKGGFSSAGKDRMARQWLPLGKKKDVSSFCWLQNACLSLSLNMYPDTHASLLTRDLRHGLVVQNARWASKAEHHHHMPGFHNACWLRVLEIRSGEVMWVGQWVQINSWSWTYESLKMRMLIYLRRFVPTSSGKKARGGSDPYPWYTNRQQFKQKAHHTWDKGI